MNRLEYHFDCLDGRYFFVCEFDDENVNYAVVSSIDELKDKNGELDKDACEEFRKQIEEAGIEKWDRKYEPVLSRIEDGIKWKVKLHRNGREYVSDGEETYEPYGYEHLIAALKLCEEKADYFLAKEKDE